MKKIVIVVPCYNEEQRLEPDRFRDAAKTNPNLFLLFVNDGSTDLTGEVINRLSEAEHTKISVQHLGQKSGKAEAVRQGILRAFELSPAFVGFWDADLATPLEEIPRFARVLELCPEIDIVMGSRVALLGRNIERVPLRHYLGRLAATLVSLTLKIGAYDTQCGAKLFRATESMKRVFDDPFSSSWLFDVEIIMRYLGLRGKELVCPERCGIYELPLNRWRDREGSTIRSYHYMKALYDLFRIWKRYR